MMEVMGGRKEEGISVVEGAPQVVVDVVRGKCPDVDNEGFGGEVPMAPSSSESDGRGGR